MQGITPITRISLGLVLLTVSIVVLLDVVGILPEAPDDVLHDRLRISEELSLRAAQAAASTDLASMRAELRLATKRHSDLMSTALRTHQGQLLVVAGDHARLWNPPRDGVSSRSHIRIPIARDGRPWATLEMRYLRDTRPWYGQLIARPAARLLGAIAVLGFVSYFFYLRRALKHLDPSSVIPTRVQTALDVMAEGVLLIDEKESVVIVNTACAEKLARTKRSFVGTKISELPWKPLDGPRRLDSPPWVEALRESRASTGFELGMETDDGGHRQFVVNASPVLDGWGSAKGAIVTLDDVTELETKKAELELALTELEKSRDEIRLQNEELQVMASTDPLTGVSNRRSFMERIDARFANAKQSGSGLCVIMSDIDHFKAVNDNHGHPAGDQVIRSIAETLSSEVRSSDHVCRYGGEEFLVVLPGASVEDAVEVAERMRRTVAAPGFARMPVTSSFGVASIGHGSVNIMGLIDQADSALYVAKSDGRNCVRVFDAELHAQGNT